MKIRTKPNWFERLFGRKYRVFYEDKIIYITIFAHRIYITKKD